jgi:hypothetical protein
MSSLFKDSDGTYSVRKFGGYSAIILLIYLIVSYTIANDFKEVPAGYLISINVIIAFYFVKDTLRQARINKS